MDRLGDVLRTELAEPMAFIGLGNPLFGDDGIGVEVARELLSRGVPNVWVAGVSPERCINRIGGMRHLVFVDAVEAGLDPGSIVLLDGQTLRSRYPQVSTHRLSLGLLARYVESSLGARAWLLGVQPQCTSVASGLSAKAQAAVSTIVHSVCAMTHVQSEAASQ